MYILAFLLLVAAFLCAVFCAGAAALRLWQGRAGSFPVETGARAIALLMTVSSFILLNAFLRNDFSLEYVAAYSDSLLPVFYRVTAFWAGQEGSMLFWGWSVALAGAFFSFSRSYARLGEESRLWFWLFFLLIVGFFLLIVTGWSNPFITFSRPVADGRGLNPLLRNPGMIFHPPLLFLGYGGFVIPGCLALAQGFSRGQDEEPAWFILGRPFTLVSWSLLSAGIILGAWWAYMELGWGGYWAWDPVENASLIPWLIATACLHTALLQAKRGLFPRLNSALMILVVISTFFATYVVRSGVIQSLHAFPDGGVGLPLLSLVGAGLALLAFCVPGARRAAAEKPASGPVAPLLLFLSGFLLFLTVIILIATMWPVLSNGLRSLLALVSPGASGVEAMPSGLGAEAYNRACLPIFALIVCLLVFCPWLPWSAPAQGGEEQAGKAGRDGRLPLICLGLLLFLGSVAAQTLLGRLRGLGALQALASLPSDLAAEGPYALASPLAAGAALAVFCGLLALFLRRRGLLRLPATLGAHLAHLGLALMALGVAFSGPGQASESFSLGLGQSARLRGYVINLEKLYSGEAPDYEFYEAELIVQPGGGGEAFTLTPQYRRYAKQSQGFAESSTVFSLGEEVYASLLRVDPQRGRAEVYISLNPLVNWIWVGGILLCLAPLLGLAGRRGRAVI